MFPIQKLPISEFPEMLNEIPEPPKQLYYRGNLPPQNAKHLTVVGSRNYTTYGKQTLKKLISGLRGYNIAIISGLALGVDALAHQTALDVGLYTLSVPGSGIDDKVLYPYRNKVLAQNILNSGGGLLSEYEPDFRATKWSFPQRNRIMAGLSHATLVVEATQKSGTLITAKLATEYNRDVLTIPGSIFSDHTEGPHMLIKLGATPITTSKDILEALHIDTEPTNIKMEPSDLTPNEQLIYAELSEPKDKDMLFRSINIPTQEINTTLTLMELKDLIVIDMNIVRKNQ